MFCKIKALYFNLRKISCWFFVFLVIWVNFVTIIYNSESGWIGAEKCSVRISYFLSSSQYRLVHFSNNIKIILGWSTTLFQMICCIFYTIFDGFIKKLTSELLFTSVSIIIQYGGHLTSGDPSKVAAWNGIFYNFKPECDMLNLNQKRWFMHQIKDQSLKNIMMSKWFSYFGIWSVHGGSTLVDRNSLFYAPIFIIRIPGHSSFISLSHDSKLINIHKL